MVLCLGRLIKSLVTWVISGRKKSIALVPGLQLIETPYADFLRAVAQGAPRVVDGGWWRSPERLLYAEELALDADGTSGDAGDAGE